MQNLNYAKRRTSVESVFDYLHQEIVSMRLLPGTKITEAEVAARFEISRQPVRDAFSRLENLDLLLIRPQKATVVKGFSSASLTTARFVRAAIEAEVLRRAARICNQSGADLLQAQLAKQKQAADQNDFDQFGRLDYDFHKTLCAIAKVDYAFDVIAKEKAKVDRLCVLGMTLNLDKRLNLLVDDHTDIANAIANNDENAALDAGMLHLERLDETIDAIRNEHADYFID